MSLQRNPASITIANGVTASSTFQTGQATRGSFQLPSAFTLTAATITVNVSNDGTTWTACPVEGNEANPITGVVVGGTYSLPVKSFSFRYLQLVAGTAQAAARTITFFTRD